MPIGQGERWAYDAVEHRDNAERMASDAGQQTDVVPPGTGPQGPAGQNALTATLTLDRVTLTCDKDGNLLGAGPVYASTKMTIMNGATDDTALWTFSATPPSSSGGVSYVLYADGSLDITGMYFGLYDQEITIRAQRSSWPDLYKRFSISKSLAGSPGTAGSPGDTAYTLSLKATAQAFTFDKNGAAAPASQSITFTALRQNLPGDVLTWTCARFDVNGGILSDGLLTGSGDTRALSLANFGNAAYARVSIVANPSALSDQITVVRLKDGENALSGVLTNEAANVPATTDGTVDPANWGACGGTFKVFYGLADITGAGPVYSVVSRSNFTTAQFTIDPTTGVYSVTGISGASDLATARVRASYRGLNVDKDYTLVRVRAGAAARSLALKASSQIFTFDKEGVAAPPGQSITFDVARQGIATDVLTWRCYRYASTGAAMTDGALTGTGDSRALSLASFGTAAVAQVTVTAAPSNLTDRITVVRLRDGENVVHGILTNESMNLSADYTGAVDPALWATCGGTFQVFYGLSNVTGAGPVYSVVSRSNFTTAQFTIDPVTGVYSITGMGAADLATARVRASYKGVDIDKDYTLVRVRSGAPGSGGAPGARGSMRFYLASTAATPTWDAPAAWNACAAYPPYAGGPAQPTPRDTVTLYNNNATVPWAMTRYYNGGSYPGTWLTIAEVIDGNLLVHGTVSAEGFDADALRTSNYLAGTVVIGGVTYEYAVQGAKMRRTTGLAATAPSLLVDPRGFMLGKKLFNQSWLGNIRFVALNNVWVDGAGGAACEVPTYYLDNALEINDWVSNTSQGTVGIRFNNAYTKGFRHIVLLSQAQRGQTRYFLRPAITSPVTTDGLYLQLNLQLFSFTTLDDGFGNFTYNPGSSWSAAEYPHFDIAVMLLAADGSGIWGA